jgi:RHS repeat-associated protein
MTRESTNRNLEYDYRQRTRLYFITNNTTLYEQYTYGADGNVVKRLNRSSGLIYSYVYIDGLFQYSDQIGHASNAQNHINILDQSGAIISQHRQGTFSGEVAYTNGELYMINNHVGSVIGTYDLNGTQQEGEDYYPFGDSSHHWNGNKQQRFAGKIRLSWTGYYDFGARQFIPWLAKFTSVDPLAAKSTDRNPYHYASNNPINRTDPTGMSDGKGDGKGGGGDKSASGSSGKKEIIENNQVTGTDTFYNKEGKKLGSREGTGSNYVVNDDNLAQGMSEAFKSGNGVDEAISASQDALVKMPSEKVINAVLDAVDRSNKPSKEAGDRKGGFHEEGGITGKNKEGQEVIAEAKPGLYKKPTGKEDESIDVNVFDSKDKEFASTIVEVELTYHIHPGGVVEPPLDPFGDSQMIQTQEIKYFNQPVSETDLKNAEKRTNVVTGYNIVVGARSGEVTFYDSKGVITTFDVKVFKSITGKK